MTDIESTLNKKMSKTVLPVTVFIGIEALFGFLGNGLIVSIYLRQYPRCNFRYFVLCMATIDLISCLTTLPGEMYNQLHWYYFSVGEICKMKTFFNVFTVLGSGFTLLLIAIDRYRKVCKPMSEYIQPDMALKLCAGIVAVSTGMAFPTLIFWGTQSYTIVLNSSTIVVPICEKMDDYKDTPYPLIYIIVLYIAPVCLIIMAAVGLNVCVARKVFFKMKPDPDLGHARGSTVNYSCQKSEKKVTRFSSESFASSIETIQRSVTTEVTSVDVTLTMTKNVTMETTLGEENESSNNSSPCSAKRPKSGTETQCYVDHLESGYSCEAEMAESTIETNITPKSRFQSQQELICVKREEIYKRIKRKTLIMITLTSVYVVTTVIYLGLISFVVGSRDYLQTLPDIHQVVYFFFWRLYFINCILNPVLFGALDPRFRRGLKRMFSCK